MVRKGKCATNRGAKRHIPSSPHQIISYNRPLQVVLGWRHGLLRGVWRVDLNGCVHVVVLLVEAHRGAAHGRVDAAAAHAWQTHDWSWLFRRCHLKAQKIAIESMEAALNLHLKADATVEREFDWIRVVAGLHQRREVTDADLFER